MPEVLDALTRYNGGFEPSYGDGPVCAQASDLIRGLLDADAEIWFAASGTAANALSLAALTQPHEAVLAHEASHVATDETGAPGFFGSGLGIIGLPGGSGRISPAALREALDKPEHPHWQSPAALSLTQATEFGAVYAKADLAALIDPAKEAGVRVHLDGARLANAVAGGFDPACIARLGVDILVMGGTKAGSTPTEAIVLFDKSLGRRFGARLKHGGQLASKARFLAAPWIGMLETGAWSVRAAHANAMARRLAAAMPFEIVHPRRGQRRLRGDGRRGARPAAGRRLVRLPLHRRHGALHVFLGDDGGRGGRDRGHAQAHQRSKPDPGPLSATPWGR